LVTSSPPESQGTAVVLAALLQGTVPVLRAEEMPLSAPPPPPPPKPPRRSPDLNRDGALKQNHRGEEILRYRGGRRGKKSNGNIQCCGFGLFIPDPIFFPTRNRDPLLLRSQIRIRISKI
jgi:hypothetical protein